ncbi:hypothetical protein B0H17DRAFT_1053977 [Mycena rosella]|uniref:MYND-type domain-containing protein n=1 Tax=Mycena rosella TaxID=1033263 RepID=A0AAD7GI81_MYCRO|nr:hypothetical protein B0H17DRAFT_1053977 [Mycena rosella]
MPLPCIAAVGGACYHCYSQPTELIKLQKCSGCHLVAYCNSVCQHANWPTHKRFCRAIAAFETYPFIHSLVPWVGVSTPDALVTQTKERAGYCMLQVGRDLTSNEMELLKLEPRCLYCARTDQLIRIEASLDLSIVLHSLVPCSTCRLSFACETHWELVHAEHTEMMCEGGYDGLPQCVLNQELLEDDEWNAKMLRLEPLPQYCAPLHTYRWIPARVTAAWKSLKDVTWAGKFQSQLESDFPTARGSSSVWLRRMSDILCMPMTVLYALECLNDDLAWKRKDVLTIHVIGAQMKELWNAICFENILHQLPAVKIVEVVLCGVLLESELGDDMRGGPYEINCCPDCMRRGQMRLNKYYDMHYQNLPQQLGARYNPPDLAIAFNSGASEPMYVEAWKLTIAFLVARGIPSVFTTYTHDEAIADSRLLLEAGARLVPGPGPSRNSWGSLLGKRDIGLPRRFYSDNMCLAGGFKGGA